MVLTYKAYNVNIRVLEIEQDATRTLVLIKQERK